MNVPLNRQNVTSGTNEFHFKKLKPNHAYNITVEGFRHNGFLWFIPQVFSTTDPCVFSVFLVKYNEKVYWRTEFSARICSELVEAPSNLMVQDKTDRRMRISWSPSFAADNNVLHHYQVSFQLCNLETFQILTLSGQRFTF